MKYFAAGLGLLSVLASACSGTQSEQLESAAGVAGSPTTSSSGGGAAGASSSDLCTSTADCAKGVCSAGHCKEVTCVKNTTFCTGHSVNRCNADGTLQGATQHCAAGQYCLEKAGKASCNPTVCFPDDPMCVGNVATVCRPDGSGPKVGGSDCATQACYQGQCRDRLCTPNQKSCDNGNLYLCAEGGTSRGLVEACASGYVCDATQGACVPKICDPGKMGCDSTRLTTCNAAGSAWLQTGTDCADKQAACNSGSCVTRVCSPGAPFCRDSSSLGTCNADGTGALTAAVDCSLTNSVCSDAQCKPLVCVPDELTCQNGNVERCTDGLSYSPAQVCAQGTYCLKYGSGTDCAPTPCQPDTEACVSEQLGQCAADGMSVASTVDCGVQSQVCTLAGCADSALDTLSSSTQIGTATAGELLGNVILVHTARKLTAIEADISMPQPRHLIWAVYEATNTDHNGEFDLKFQTSNSGSGAGFQSSGAISVQLEAGKSYYVGVSASDGTLAYYFDTTAVVLSSSFAHVIGSNDTSFAPSFDYPNQAISTVYHQRLTTTLP